MRLRVTAGIGRILLIIVTVFALILVIVVIVRRTEVHGVEQDSSDMRIDLRQDVARAAPAPFVSVGRTAQRRKASSKSCCPRMSLLTGSLQPTCPALKGGTYV